MAGTETRQLERMAAAGLLAAGVAHDLSNLLLVVSGNARFLAARLPGGSELRDRAEEIVRAAAAASRLSAELVQTSRQSEAASVDARAAIRELEPLLRRLVPDRIELAVSLGSEPAPVAFTHAGLQRVVLNLVQNAAAATPRHGRIGISLGRDDGHVALRVADTGRGMPEEVRAQLAQPIVAAPADSAGLGLGIVRALVEAHDATIDVDSQPGRGTAVTIGLRTADRVGRPLP
ncbi:MAG TPA: ATP-binding protein [Gaiellaceae bacterium]|nr:ATP-binding protein [Gaiellaceae bacterium]